MDRDFRDWENFCCLRNIKNFEPLTKRLSKNKIIGR